nr:PD-(D/E)XK nuclease family protein [Bacilli bacterium]
VSVVDYKTGRKIKHNVNDFSTISQCVVYAYILEHVKKLKVSNYEYRYIRLKDRVTNINDGLNMDECYNELEKALLEIKEAYDTGKFTIKHGHCKECYYAPLCKERS